MTADRAGVRIGEGSPDMADIGVSGVHVHENYDSWTVVNDICMLDLEDDLDLDDSDFIDAIDIPDEGQDYPSGQMCTISGKGLKMDVKIVTDDECRVIYGENEITDSMLCGLSDGACYEEFCQGVSGEALMCGTGLDGFVSWGYGCILEYPSVYVQTSYYVPWIMSHMT